MTFTQLKYAIALKKYGSFKRASSHLDISQPGLSLQIQKLEEDLGITLFDRSTSPIELTSEGEVFLSRAEEIVAGFDVLRGFTNELKSGFNDTLKLGIIPTLAPFIVPLFIDDLQLDFPDFKLDIYEMTTDEVIAAVKNGEMDAGLISTPVEVPGIRSNLLFYERFFFYQSGDEKEDNVSLENIDYNKLWLLNEGNCFRDQINNFCDLKKIRRNKRFVYRSNSIDALVRIVDTKGGMTIMPELTTLSLSEEQEENISPISNKAREISIILRNVSNKERYVDKLGEYIRKNIPHSMLSKEKVEVVDPGITVK